MTTEFGDRHYKPEEVDEAAARRIGLIRAGLRNKDQETLDVVKEEFQSMFGEFIGGKIFDNLLFHKMAEINREDIGESYPEITL